MVFELLPTIDVMTELYRKPRTYDRFREYLGLLQGNKKGELVFPVSGYNPMAKEHAAEKLTELKKLDAEGIARQTIKEANAQWANHSAKGVYKVALNLLDDFRGGWTNRYTADYDSKFKLNALVNRRFCTPVFWTSETYTVSLVRERVMQYMLRTIYWLTHPRPATLQEHIQQEQFVARHLGVITGDQPAGDFRTMDAFYQRHKHSDDYAVIFNFFYGDAAAASLGFPRYGIAGGITGYEYAGLLQ